MDTNEYIHWVSDIALDRFDSVMAWLGLEGGKRSGPEYLPLNPRRGDHTPGSFSINTTTGAWADFADDAKGGDLVSLVAYQQGVRQPAAADALADYLGLPVRAGRPDAHNRATTNAGASASAKVSGTPKETRHKAKSKADEPAAVCVMPVPDDAPPPPKAHSCHGAPAARYAYKDVAGRVNFYHDRYEPKVEGERKQFSPLTLWRLPSGAMRWQFKAPPGPRPIYGLDLLTAKPEAQVVIVEGEKARAAAEMLLPDAVVICWQGGAMAVAKADWRALASRAVVLWPDADSQRVPLSTEEKATIKKLAGEPGALSAIRDAQLAKPLLPEKDQPGRKCMDKLAALLQHAGAASVHRVRLDRLALDATADESNSPTLTPGTPLANGDDAADMVARGWTAEHMALIWPKAGASGDGGILFDAVADHIADGGKVMTERGNTDPAPDGVPKRFILNNKGLHTLEENGEPKWFAQPLEVLAQCRDPHGTGWAKLTLFRNPDGQEVREVIPLAMTAGDGTELEKHFLSHGFMLAPFNGKRFLREYLREANPTARARIVKTTGWHQAGQSEPVYVLPSRTFGASNEQWLYDVNGDKPKHFAARGTLSEWRDNVAALCVGNTRLVFAVSAAFAAPLLYLTKYESGGFHFGGNSSDGKTTAMIAACSVSGPPDEYKQQWRVTDNSLEGLAVRYCDALLPLDDLGQSDAKTIGPSIYMLGNEKGKSRMTEQTGMRKTLEWRLLFLSTGELGLEAKMNEAGQTVRAGQESRMAEIPADAGAGKGAFENTHDSDDSQKFSDHVKAMSRKYYGMALQAWLEKLITADQMALVGQVDAATAKFIETQLSSEAHGQAKRVARRFALVGAAGELATAFGITGWDKGEAMKAAARCFNDWLSARGGETDQEQREWLRQVRAFLNTHAESRFTSTERSEIDEKHAPRTAYRAGFRRPVSTVDGQAWEFFILPDVWRDEVCKGFNSVSVARLMHSRGWLIGKEEKGRAPRSRLTVDGQGRPWVHHITHEFLEADL